MNYAEKVGLFIPKLLFMVSGMVVFGPIFVIQFFCRTLFSIFGIKKEKEKVYFLQDDFGVGEEEKW